MTIATIIAAALLGGWAGLRIYLRIRSSQYRDAGWRHDGLATGVHLHPQGLRSRA